MLRWTVLLLIRWKRYRAPFAISLSSGAAHPHMSSLEVAEVWLWAAQHYVLPLQEAKKHPNASS